MIPVDGGIGQHCRTAIRPSDLEAINLIERTESENAGGGALGIEGLADVNPLIGIPLRAKGDSGAYR